MANVVIKVHIVQVICADSSKAHSKVQIFIQTKFKCVAPLFAWLNTKGKKLLRRVRVSRFVYTV